MYEAAPCVRSGMCCKTGVCGLPEAFWDKEKGQCGQLRVAEAVEGVEIHSCALYENYRDDPRFEWNPAFGAGCCMTLFNENRRRILQLQVRGKVPSVAE